MDFQIKNQGAKEWTGQKNISSFSHITCVDRDIKVVRPLYSVEVIETETARFETEISEEDVHGHWKLKGEALHQSPVNSDFFFFQCAFYYFYINDL